MIKFYVVSNLFILHFNFEITRKILIFQLTQDPSFKPQGGRLGENDMEYDTDEKSMATLRRQLRIAQGEYLRYKR